MWTCWTRGTGTRAVRTTEGGLTSNSSVLEALTGCGNSITETALRFRGRAPLEVSLGSISGFLAAAPDPGYKIYDFFKKRDFRKSLQTSIFKVEQKASLPHCCCIHIFRPITTLIPSTESTYVGKGYS